MQKQAAECIQRQWRRHQVMQTLRRVNILPNTAADLKAFSKSPRVLENTLAFLKRTALDHYCMHCDCAKHCPRSSHALFARLMQPTESKHYQYPVCRAFWNALMLPRRADTILVESGNALVHAFVANTCVWGLLCGHVALYEIYQRERVAFWQRCKLHQMETRYDGNMASGTSELEDIRTRIYKIIRAQHKKN